PDSKLTVVHRSDGSGTTFNWVNYLSKVSDTWKGKVGEGTSVNWPTGIGGKGNEGVALLASCCSSSRGSYDKNQRLSRWFATRPARRAAFGLAAGVPGSPTSAVFALVGVVEPAVSVVSPHPSRVAAAAFHEFCAAAGAAPVSSDRFCPDVNRAS